MYDSESDAIAPNNYVVTIKCSTYQDIDTVRNVVGNAVMILREGFIVVNGGDIRQTIKPLDLQCGYCKEQSIAWVDWKTIGRPKGAPVCQTHLDKMNVPDNFGEYPSVKYYEKES
jgi:hypothetical protein